MKTLVLQLARLGDIYQSWPILRALKREEKAEVHLLTRSKFAVAIEGLDVIDRHWPLDSRAILTPLIDERPDLDGSLEKLGELCDALRDEGFDRIINLSFSPLSSWIAAEICCPWTEVRGYSRTTDGFLSIPDDASAYFYAQVGPGRANRIHITDLFAAVSGVELKADDFSATSRNEDAKSVLAHSLRDPIVIHAGASDLSKTLGWSKWIQVVKGLVAAHDGDIVLIGSPEERELSERITAVSGPRPVVNLVGRTSLGELFSILGLARVLIGGDSAPMHIAALTGTPVLNLSFPMVSFWETGPKSAGSRVITLESDDSVPSDMIVREAMSMVRGEVPVIAAISSTGPLGSFVAADSFRAKDTGSGSVDYAGVMAREFEWQLLQGLYMSEEFPEPKNELFLEGVRRLAEVNELALEQIASLRAQPDNRTATAILDRADEIISSIARMVPEASPIVRWFQTEKLRIGPMPFEELIEVTSGAHARLGEVLKIYIENPAGREGARGHDDIVLG